MISRLQFAEGLGPARRRRVEGESAGGGPTRGKLLGSQLAHGDGILAQGIQEHGAGHFPRPGGQRSNDLPLDFGAGVVQQAAGGGRSVAVAITGQGLGHFQPHPPRRIAGRAEHHRPRPAESAIAATASARINSERSLSKSAKDGPGLRVVELAQAADCRQADRQIDVVQGRRQEIAGRRVFLAANAVSAAARTRGSSSLRRSTISAGIKPRVPAAQARRVSMRTSAEGTWAAAMKRGSSAASTCRAKARRSSACRSA